MFGDLPDGEFLGNLSELDSWVQDVLEETAAERYVSVAYEQGHQDHDALHYVVHRWTGAAHLEFPLYWHYAKTWQRIGEFADPSGAETRMLDIDEIGMKRAMLRCFESQTVARNVAGYEVLSRLRGKRPLLAEAERLRRVLKPDYSKPVHQEPARSKIMKCARWHQWENATAQWVASMGDPDWT